MSKIYEVQYGFTGSGIATIKADSEEEARSKFYEGEDVIKDVETGQDYDIETVKEVK